MSRWTHYEIDQALHRLPHIEQLVRRCAIAELRCEHVEKWMKEHAALALDEILAETSTPGFDLKLRYQNKVNEIIRDVGGN